MSAAQHDVLALAPPDTPNWHLAAPEGIREDIAGTRSVFYPVKAMALHTCFRNILHSQPRTKCLYLARSEQEADIYEQRSRIFGFKDVIQVWCLQQNEEPPCSGLVIYSRALTGHYDFGVNRRRIWRLLSELSEALGKLD